MIKVVFYVERVGGIYVQLRIICCWLEVGGILVELSKWVLVEGVIVDYVNDDGNIFSMSFIYQCFKGFRCVIVFIKGYMKGRIIVLVIIVFKFIDWYKFNGIDFQFF